MVLFVELANQESNIDFNQELSEDSSNLEVAVNKDIAEGKWKQLKGTVRETWGKLTEDEVDEIGGRKDHFLGKVQEKYGMSMEDAEKEWDKLHNS